MGTTRLGTGRKASSVTHSIRNTRCAGKLAKVKEWQTRLIALQDSNQVTDCDKMSEIEALQKQLSETMRSVNDDWKNKGLAPWKNDFLHSMTIDPPDATLVLPLKPF